MFTNKKREGINTFVCAFSLYVTETPKASINKHEPPLPIIAFGIVAYAFVGQPFSKQLYSTALTDRPLWKQRFGRWAVKNGLRKSEKKMAGVFHAVMIV